MAHSCRLGVSNDSASGPGMDSGMTTGADHFRIAQDLTETVRHLMEDRSLGTYSDQLTALAQVHATLASAAVQAVMLAPNPLDRAPYFRQWQDALNTTNDTNA